MTELEESAVYRKLEGKIKILGMEALDFILLLLTAAVLNLIFGRTGFAPFAVFGIPSASAVVLIMGKRGKPEGHLKHCLRFWLSAGFYSAGEKGKHEQTRRKKIYG